MGAETRIEQVQQGPQIPHGSLASRVGFRFCFAYFGGPDNNWKATFTFQRPAREQLTLDGDMDNHKIHMRLQLVDRNKFLLVNRGFHWIQEYPLNR